MAVTISCVCDVYYFEMRVTVAGSADCWSGEIVWIRGRGVMCYGIREHHSSLGRANMSCTVRLALPTMGTTMSYKPDVWRRPQSLVDLSCCQVASHELRPDGDVDGQSYVTSQHQQEYVSVHWPCKCPDDHWLLIWYLWWNLGRRPPCCM